MMITERIQINPKVMLGKPVIRGTRITVELILRKLAEGATEPGGCLPSVDTRGCQSCHWLCCRHSCA